MEMADKKWFAQGPITEKFQGVFNHMAFIDELYSEKTLFTVQTTLTALI